MKVYRFNKTGKEWYTDLPGFLEQGGSMSDLQMVEGADTMLDMIAGNKDTVSLAISDRPFDMADKIILLEKCDPLIGGGYYMMSHYRDAIVNQKMWLCHVTEFVFNDMPAEIFIRKE